MYEHPPRGKVVIMQSISGLWAIVCIAKGIADGLACPVGRSITVQSGGEEDDSVVAQHWDEIRVRLE